MDIKQDAYEPERIVQRLEQRRRVAELMQISDQDLSVTEDTAQRIELIDALIQLGRIEKIPSERPIQAAMPRNTSVSQVSPEEISQKEASPPPEPRKRPVSDQSTLSRTSEIVDEEIESSMPDPKSSPFRILLATFSFQRPLLLSKMCK